MNFLSNEDTSRLAPRYFIRKEIETMTNSELKSKVMILGNKQMRLFQSLGF
jgi:hypothetical protein